MKSLKGVIAEMGFDLESVGYSYFSPFEALDFLENYIKTNEIRHIIGHSLGGFYDELCYFLIF